MQTAEWAVLVDKHKALMKRNPNVGFIRVDPQLLQAVVERRPDLLATKSGGDIFDLEPATFAEHLSLCLDFEKVHRDILMRKFDQTNVRIRTLVSDSKEQWFQYELRGLAKGHPKLVLGDRIILDDQQNQPEQFEIKEIDGDVVKFRWLGGSSGEKRWLLTGSVNMSFHSLAIPNERCKRNLAAIKGFIRVQQMLFMGKKYKAALGPNWIESPVLKEAITDEKATRLDFVDGRLRKRNELQRQAIISIMEGKFRPNLYILFGPPGTGKTATLIEAVGQIYQRNLEAKILLCAQSNSCVDDLVAKLIGSNLVKKSEILRVCSADYYRKLGKQVKRLNYFKPSNDFSLQGIRVVVTTNMTTPKLKMKFDYALMDEASSANLPESFLSCAKLKEEGCFVLAGDPKQLGPVVMAREIEKGLKKSLLELMFSKDLYGYHNNEYDSRFITKLVVSYRCDPRLIQINNKEFYKNELKFTGKTPPGLLEKLKLDRPLAFKRVDGHDRRMIENYSPSWCNDQEAEACIEFLFELYLLGYEPDQIGIITYYTLQKAVLLEQFEKKLVKYQAKLDAVARNKKRANKVNGPNHLRQLYNLIRFKFVKTGQQSESGSEWLCKIDTVDAFQGNERNIIILSTVRTRRNRFFTDEDGRKRFNVATSRAKWLLMVMGHPEVLNFDKLWRSFAKEAQLV